MPKRPDVSIQSQDRERIRAKRLIHDVPQICFRMKNFQ